MAISLPNHEHPEHRHARLLRGLSDRGRDRSADSWPCVSRRAPAARSREAWSNGEVPLHMSSPVLVGDHLFGFSHRKCGAPLLPRRGDGKDSLAVRRPIRRERGPPPRRIAADRASEQGATDLRQDRRIGLPAYRVVSGVVPAYVGGTRPSRDSESWSRTRRRSSAGRCSSMH